MPARASPPAFEHFLNIVQRRESQPDRVRVRALHGVLLNARKRHVNDRTRRGRDGNSTKLSEAPVLGRKWSGSDLNRQSGRSTLLAREDGNIRWERADPQQVPSALMRNNHAGIRLLSRQSFRIECEVLNVDTLRYARSDWRADGDSVDTMFDALEATIGSQPTDAWIVQADLKSLRCRDEPILLRSNWRERLEGCRLR